MFWLIRNPRIEPLRTRWRRRRRGIYKHFSRQAMRDVWRLTITPGSRNGEEYRWLRSNVGLSLRTDSAPSKSLESLLHVCSSWFLAVSSRMVLRSPNNFPRNSIECWPLTSLQFFHIIEAFHMNFTEIPICSDNWSWSSWSRRSCSSPARAWSISLRWDSIFPFNFWIFLLSQSTWLLFLNLYSTIGENRLFLSFKENPDLLIFWVATRFFSAAWT